MQQNNDHSQCILLALCVCALGRGLPEKVLGLGQPRGGGGVPPPLRRGVGVPPPPLQPPKLSNTPRGHTLAGGGPRASTPDVMAPHGTRRTTRSAAICRYGPGLPTTTVIVNTSLCCGGWGCDFGATAGGIIVPWPGGRIGGASGGSPSAVMDLICAPLRGWGWGGGGVVNCDMSQKIQ